MDSIVKSNLPEIKFLLQRYGVVSASLFGSAATGNMNDESDVDFLVSFNPDLNYTQYEENYFDLLYALQTLLNKNVDLIAEETLSNPYLIQSVNSQKIAVL